MGYKRPFALSYGIGVAIFLICVKSCIDSWDQALTNPNFGPETSELNMVSILTFIWIGQKIMGTLKNFRSHQDLLEYPFILSICLLGWSFMSGQGLFYAWLALGLALGWPLAWPLAGSWPGPWLAIGQSPGLALALALCLDP